MNERTTRDASSDLPRSVVVVVDGAFGCVGKRGNHDFRFFPQAVHSDGKTMCQQTVATVLHAHTSRTVRRLHCSLL